MIRIKIWAYAFAYETLIKPVLGGRGQCIELELEKCCWRLVMKSVATRKSHTVNLQTNLDIIYNDLMLECKLCSPGTRLAKSLRDKLTG